MAKFTSKAISRGQTVADRLQQARTAKSLSLADLAKETKIQQKYLEYLEAGDYQNLPGDVYIRTWIKLYAQAVDLPPAELLRDYKLEQQIGHKTLWQPPEKKFNWHNILKPKVIKWSAIAIVVSIFLAYLGWQVNNIIAPPPVTIFEPTNNYRTTEASVTVSGQTLPEVQLKINNEIILLDQAGNFSQLINLSVGLNNLEISAKKKLSRSRNLELIVLRENIE